MVNSQRNELKKWASKREKKTRLRRRTSTNKQIKTKAEHAAQVRFIMNEFVLDRVTKTTIHDAIWVCVYAERESINGKWKCALDVQLKGILDEILCQLVVFTIFDYLCHVLKECKRWWHRDGKCKCRQKNAAASPAAASSINTNNNINTAALHRSQCSDYNITVPCFLLRKLLLFNTY